MSINCEFLECYLETPSVVKPIGPNRRITTPLASEIPLSMQDFEKECQILYACLSKRPSDEVLEKNGKTVEQNLKARQYTFAHTIRVFHYALFLAQSTNQSPEVIRAIGKATLGHDIGKSVDELVSVHDYDTDKLDKDYNKPLMDRHVEFSLKIAKKLKGLGETS